MKKIIYTLFLMLFFASCSNSEVPSIELGIPKIERNDFMDARPWSPDFNEKYKLLDFYPELAKENFSDNELKVIGDWTGTVSENGVINSVELLPNGLLLLEMNLLQKSPEKLRRLVIFGSWKIDGSNISAKLYGFFWDGIKYFSKKTEFPLLNLSAIKDNYTLEVFHGFDVPKELSRKIQNKKIYGQYIYRLMGSIDIVGGTGKKYPYESILKNIEYLNKNVSGEDICSSKRDMEEYFEVK